MSQELEKTSENRAPHRTGSLQAVVDRSPRPYRLPHRRAPSFEQGHDQMEADVTDHRQKNQRLQRDLPAQLLLVTTLLDQVADRPFEDLDPLVDPRPPCGELQS